jgi:hypothetical protein
MNVEPRAESRDFECEVLGSLIKGTVTQYLNGMFSPESLNDEGLRYSVNVVCHGTRYKFNMFHETGEWHTRLLSVFGDDEIHLASLETFISKNKKIDLLFEDALTILESHVPGLDNEQTTL